MDVKEEIILGDDIARHWYYRSKFAAVRRCASDLSPRTLLDVGAGSGFFSRELLRLTGAQSATCVDPAYPTEREERVAGKQIAFRRAVSSSDADLVLLMDVLEHVDDDVGLLQEYVGKVQRGTCFLITVPAFQWLWSGHDVFLEHRRRYTLQAIEQVVRAAGLRVERGSYFFGALFPLAAALRVGSRLRGVPTNEARSQLKKHGRIENALLHAACAAELPLFSRNRMVGLSAFVRARLT
jgi:SAM-dependent methyltransferase